MRFWPPSAAPARRQQLATVWDARACPCPHLRPGRTAEPATQGRVSLAAACTRRAMSLQSRADREASAVVLLSCSEV